MMGNYEAAIPQRLLLAIVVEYNDKEVISLMLLTIYHNVTVFLLLINELVLLNKNPYIN